MSHGDAVELAHSNGADGLVGSDDAASSDGRPGMIVDLPDSTSEDDPVATLQDSMDEEVEQTFHSAMDNLVVPPMAPDAPRGYVTNARNATASSDAFSFWAQADETAFGVGSIVRHVGRTPDGTEFVTYGIVDASEGQTLGLDDLAIHVYETDARPPLQGLAPAASRRRPVVVWRARVLSSGSSRNRPVLDGPVYPVRQDTDLLAAHGRHDGQPKDVDWLAQLGMLLGFYEDDEGNFSPFAEERTRVLGPQQGHVVMSGKPGAGKTSLFVMQITALFSQLRRLEQEQQGGGHQ